MSEKLNFSIGVDLGELNKGLEKASNSVKSFAEKNKEAFEKVGKGLVDVGAKFSVLSAGIIAGVGAMGLLAKNVGNIADRLLDLADITGMTTDAIQEWQYVAKIAGVSTETVTNATEGLVRRLKDVGEEGNPAVEVLQGLGIASKDATGQIRNAGTIVDETIMKLASLDNVTERNTIGSQLFGGAWKDVAPILSLGGDSIAQLREEAQSLGIVMSNEALQSANQFRQATEKLTAKFEALKNNIGARLAPILTNTLLPLIDKYLIPAFEKVADAVGDVIDWFNDLSPTMKLIIGSITGLLVALGPLLVALGGIITIMPILISGFAALISPIGLIVVGIVALTVAIVKNWDTIKQWAQDVVNYFIRLYNESLLLRAGIEGVILIFKNLFEAVKFIFGSIYTIITTVFSNIYEYLKGVAKLIFAVLTFDVAAIKKGLGETIGAIKTNVSGMLTELTQKSKTLFQSIAENQAKAIDNVLNGKVKEVDWSTSEKSKTQLTNDVAGAVASGVAQGMEGKQRDKSVNAGMQSLGATPGIAPAITSDLSQLGRVDIAFSEMELRLIEFNQRASELVQTGLYNVFAGIGDAIGDALANGGSVIGAVGNSLLQTMGKFLSSFGDQLIQFALASKAFSTLQLSLANPATALASAGVALAAGIALKAFGGAIASSASSGGGGGGSIQTGGASQSYGNGGSFSSSVSNDRGNEVVFRISGSDLLGVLRRAEGNELRLG